MRFEPKLRHALSHPVRREVLRRLNHSPDACSVGQLASGMAPVELSRVSYHMQVLVRGGVVDSEASGAVAEQAGYLVTVLDAQALAVLRETDGWDREQREAGAKDVAALGRRQRSE